ncbi:response regulator [Rhodococcus qingshengii]|uniref:response regulator n=1 Tax=Rhodococcus qingshengii TaxID=334542 RepID=UPI001BE574D6|nr:response regulator transcription factor [Rhodococcus qingshengii]MBT2276277.1 response regulator transcription factor [Rhodococcus qingshengii]
MTIRVLVADDQRLIRAGFATLVDTAPDLEVVAEAVDGADALTLARLKKPDVVLMDIRMPGTDGLSATRLITQDPDLREVHVLVLTTFESDEYVVAALRAGASGFLGKGVEPDDLLVAIRIVASGEALLSPRATSALIGQFLSRPHDAPSDVVHSSLEVLTDREREVVARVGHGLSNIDIAGELHLSPLTVKTHISRAKAKLNARDRAQLVVQAYQSGLVRAGVPPSP